MKPYWESDGLALYLGDCRDVIPALGLTADLIVADPPYEETSMPWDRWPEPGVVERMTLRQIWPRLAPRHQRVLAALATAGTYQGTAEHLRLWHEHEQPSRPWAISRAPRDPDKALRRALRRRGRRTS